MNGCRPSRCSIASSRRKHEEGYVLLTLLLIAALLAIAIAIILPDTVFELKRDREEEMVHRGVQYTRAIQAYYKKFGRYPTRLEDLENTNNLRFLRRPYKDPENKNQDFRLLHFGEVKLALTGGIAGGVTPGATTAGSAGGPNTAPGAVTNALAAGENATSGGSTLSTSGQDASASSAGEDTSGSAQPGDSNTGNQVFGGGPIIGVASNSKDATIRRYNDKMKYNEWQFIYDPSADRGGLITTPYQPLAALANLNQSGQNGQPGTTGSSPFGPSPFGANPNSGNAGPVAPGAAPPPGTSQQPQ